MGYGYQCHPSQADYLAEPVFEFYPGNRCLQWGGMGRIILKYPVIDPLPLGRAKAELKEIRPMDGS